SVVSYSCLDRFLHPLRAVSNSAQWLSDGVERLDRSHLDLGGDKRPAEPRRPLSPRALLQFGCRQITHSSLLFSQPAPCRLVIAWPWPARERRERCAARTRAKLFKPAHHERVRRVLHLGRLFQIFFQVDRVEWLDHPHLELSVCGLGSAD